MALATFWICSLHASISHMPGVWGTCYLAVSVICTVWEVLSTWQSLLADKATQLFNRGCQLGWQLIGFGFTCIKLNLSCPTGCRIFAGKLWERVLLSTDMLSGLGIWHILPGVYCQAGHVGICILPDTGIFMECTLRVQVPMNWHVFAPILNRYIVYTQIKSPHCRWNTINY